jgi:hypothetical protein
VAPTYDEWGMFLRELYEIDPDMKCDYYAHRADFHDKTKYAFVPHPWNLEHPVACTGCVLSERDEKFFTTALNATTPPSEMFGPLDMKKVTPVWAGGNE